jgi:hypothetical protein
MTTRALTLGEITLARSIFGDAIDYSRVRLHHRRWWWFQPKNVAMSPDGDLWFHAEGTLWQEDFSRARLSAQALFIHEMTHVWQAQKGGRFYLPLMRHPFCRYRYALMPGKPFRRYGLEQQAEIIKDAFLSRRKGSQTAALEALLPAGFSAATAQV